MEKESKRILVITAPAVVSALLAITLLSVYLSPLYSWNSSIRDRDGDGVPDARDAFPDDSSRTIPLIELNITAENHQWRIGYLRAMDHTGDGNAKIPISDVLVQVYDQFWSISYSAPMVSIGPSADTGISFHAANISDNLGTGDIFVLDVNNYRPGSHFVLEKLRSHERYCEYEMDLPTPTISGNDAWTQHSFVYEFTQISTDTLWQDISIGLWTGNNTIVWDPGELVEGNYTFPSIWRGDTRFVCSLGVGSTTSPLTYILAGEYVNITIWPELDAGIAYRLTIYYDFSTEPMMISQYQRQLPHDVITIQSLHYDSVRIVFDGISEVSWDDILIRLNYGANSVTWNVSAAPLSGGGLRTAYCGEQFLDGLTITCEVTDLDGNGTVDSGDLFDLTSDSAFFADVTFTISILYKPNLDLLGQTNFLGMGYPPACTLSRATITYGQKITIVSITIPLEWDDMTITLSDGTNTVAWYPSTLALAGGPPATEIFSAQTLGTLTVFLNITDIGGNGLANGGDYITLTTGSTQTFSFSTTYTVMLIHEPTSAEIGHITFTG